MKLEYVFLASGIKRKGTARETDSFPNFLTLAANVYSVVPTTYQRLSDEYVLKNVSQPSFLRASCPTYCRCFASRACQSVKHHEQLRIETLLCKSKIWQRGKSNSMYFLLTDRWVKFPTLQRTPTQHCGDVCAS